ncbi:ferritin-like domain-containing protein [Sphingosinicella microcystinivorans]|uniref:ferritin-like domain-containing protein n=1 Tax=Sphingosinicella microcystinivorans TaxID=335406 RepID=UPI0022F38232|nr:ferritin family protein [Sphingosinicella microcystinivorans]WBX82838.1 ferritin family protein [Sphingosinicella microcystinivorans]
MPKLKGGSFGSVETMEELFAVAAAMEREAIAGYSQLAQHMRDENQPELAATFEHLVAEETRHLNDVSHLALQITGKTPAFDDKGAAAVAPELFAFYRAFSAAARNDEDDDDAATVAPELVTSYRALSTAVHNEERAFAFWTYVAAGSTSRELCDAAEQMAREELQHVATLRRERRRAFHRQRASLLATTNWTLASLEQQFANLVDGVVSELESSEMRESLIGCAAEARTRAGQLRETPLGNTPLLNHVQGLMTARLRPICELLLDCYLDLGDHASSEAARARAQVYAAQMLECISAVQEIARSTSPGGAR